MVSIRKLAQGLSTLALLQPSLAAHINPQLFMSTGKQVATASHNQPACQKVFHAKVHTPPSTTAGDKRLPVQHRDERLYAVEGVDPTQWTFEKLDNGRYRIYSVHPSGTKHYWNRDNSEITIRDSESSETEFNIAQAEESDTPFSKMVVFRDERCLVLPYNSAGPVKMLAKSQCEPIILELREPLQWTSPNDMCKAEKKSDVETNSRDDGK